MLKLICIATECEYQIDCVNQKNCLEICEAFCDIHHDSPHLLEISWDGGFWGPFSQGSWKQVESVITFQAPRWEWVVWEDRIRWRMWSYFGLREGNGLSGSPESGGECLHISGSEKGMGCLGRDPGSRWRMFSYFGNGLSGMGAQEPVAGRRNGRRRLSVNLGPATRAVQCPQKVS